jgi:isoquinoline 1-oxidoreductase beta subunit
MRKPFVEESIAVKHHQAEVADFKQARRYVSASPESGIAIESWPASGGGLLIGMTLSAFGASRLLRKTIPNTFLRIGANDGVTITAPYVAFEEEAAICLAIIGADELDLPRDLVRVDIGLSAKVRPIGLEVPRAKVIDIDRITEYHFRTGCAAAREMLVAEAAEIWEVPSGSCCTLEGVVVHQSTGRYFYYDSIAGDAALQPVPREVTLHCGRRVTMSS